MCTQRLGHLDKVIVHIEFTSNHLNSNGIWTWAGGKLCPRRIMLCVISAVVMCWNDLCISVSLYIITYSHLLSWEDVLTSHLPYVDIYTWSSLIPLSLALPLFFRSLSLFMFLCLSLTHLPILFLTHSLFILSHPFHVLLWSLCCSLILRPSMSHSLSLSVCLSVSVFVSLSSVCVWYLMCLLF